MFETSIFTYLATTCFLHQLHETQFISRKLFAIQIETLECINAIRKYIQLDINNFNVNNTTMLE